MPRSWSHSHKNLFESLDDDDQDKIPQINDEIKNMLKSNTNLYESEQVEPYCYVSLVKWTFAELTLGCDLKYYKSKDHFVGAQHDILLKVVKIIENHGASLVEYHLAG
ncbi:hypothetical protein LIER_32400 [Lithospermum erythrorhizon]|uniref:Uncharacterized protein n=1 Tax=Lithospermum erythrorhizon TaxID=34254 RepID=A0AAV3RXL9_LITER